jgi:hypothetical protein
MWAGPTRVEEGLARSRQVLDRAGTNHKGRASAMFMQANFVAARGHLEVARSLIVRTRGLLQEVALTVWTAGPLTQMAGSIELGAGEPEAAEQQLRWGYETLEEVGEMAWLPTLAALLTQAVYAQGRHEEAWAYAEHPRELAGGEDVVTHILWRRVLADAWARAGRASLAEELGREAVEFADATDSLILQGEARLGLADVLDRLERAPGARQAVQDAIDCNERKGAAQGRRRGGSYPKPPESSPSATAGDTPIDDRVVAVDPLLTPAQRGGRHRRGRPDRLRGYLRCGPASRPKGTTRSGWTRIHAGGPTCGVPSAPWRCARDRARQRGSGVRRHRTSSSWLSSPPVRRLTRGTHLDEGTRDIRQAGALSCAAASTSGVGHPLPEAGAVPYGFPARLINGAVGVPRAHDDGSPVVHGVVERDEGGFVAAVGVDRRGERGGRLVRERPLAPTATWSCRWTG